MSQNPRQQRHSSDSFPGFEPLTANYLYCPNQFFDVCLPNCSRGTVRIVAYILRQTLGWLDANGNPRQQNIAVTYRDLIQKAGVSRGAIGPALKEAVTSGFLIRTQQGSAKSAGQTGQSASYSLRWNDDDYRTELDDFAGFYAGEGYRTPIPNSFFDKLIVFEPLAVLKVVGTVLRHTVGYQNQFGRRRVAPLSYKYISQYARLSQGRVLAQALQSAMQSGYIECVQEGVFALNAEARRAAQYSVRWLCKNECDSISSKRPPVKTADSNQFKNTIAISSEKPSLDRFNNATKEKTEVKNTNKQQFAAVEKEGIQSLLKAGFDRKTAEKLMAKHGADVVGKQLKWLDARSPNENPVGMLRKAIEENWSKPKSVQSREIRSQVRVRQEQQVINQHQEDAQISKRKRIRNQRRDRLLKEWGSATIEERQQWIREAAQHETSNRLAEIIRRETADVTQPKLQVLEVLAAARNLPTIASNSSVNPGRMSVPGRH